MFLTSLKTHDERPGRTWFFRIASLVAIVAIIAVIAGISLLRRQMAYPRPANRR